MRRYLFLWFLSAVQFGSIAHAQQVVESDLAITGVNVLPMTDNRILVDYIVLIKDDEIVAVAPRDEIAPDANTIVVSGAGKYILPGFADMHTHASEQSLLLYVANGVTLVRNMSGSPAIVGLRERVVAGDLLGPRIVTATPILDGDPPSWPGSISLTNPDKVRAVVDELLDAGYDFLKLYEGLSADTYAALIEYARELNFPTAGHVPQSLSLEEVLDLEIGSIEHLIAWDAAEARRGSQMEAALRGANFTQDLINMAAIARQIASGNVAPTASFDVQRREDLAQSTVESGVWIVPTLVTYNAALAPRDEASVWRVRPEMRYVPSEVLDAWSGGGIPILNGIDDSDLHSLKMYFDVWLKRTRSLYEAGARLLVGTDAPARFLVQGFSVHDELSYFVESGMTPYDALLAATRSPAEFLQDESFGTVEVGSRADLILLDANPLDDIAATRKIAGVVVAGRFLDRGELDEMLASVADGFRTED